MPDQLPLHLRPAALTARNATIKGQIRLSHMKRLMVLLNDSEGTVDVSLEFTTGHDIANLLRGQITGELSMVCQRCLSPLKIEIDRPFEIGFAYSELEAERMQKICECHEMQGEEVFVRDIIEDELLLSVPQFPVHEDLNDCDLSVAGRL